MPALSNIFLALIDHSSPTEIWIAGGTLCGFLLFSGGIWLLYKKQPKLPHTIPVQYTPPKGMSPAAVGFFKDSTFKPHHLSAVLLSLIHQGVLSIQQTKAKRFLRKQDYHFNLEDANKADSVAHANEAFFLYFLLPNYSFPKKEYYQFNVDISHRQSQANPMPLIIYWIIAIPVSAHLQSMDVFAIFIGLFFIFKERQLMLPKHHRLDYIHEATFLEELSPYFKRTPQSLKVAVDFCTLISLCTAILLLLGPLLVSLSIFLGMSILVFVFYGMPDAKNASAMDIYAHVIGFDKYLTQAEKSRILFHEKDKPKWLTILPYAIALGHSKHWPQSVDHIKKVLSRQLLSTFWRQSDALRNPYRNNGIRYWLKW